MKILIAGMGRSGTSFIMKMFMALGVPSYCKESNYINNEISAGLELSLDQCLEFIQNKNQEGIAKSPWIYEICQCEEFCSANIDLVIIPIRDPNIATMSRLVNEIKNISFDQKNLSLEQSFSRINAGNHYFVDGFEEMRCLSSALVLLLHECSKKNINLSFVPFPEIGDKKTAKSWAKSIEPFVSKFGADSRQITNWINENFDLTKTLSTNDTNDMETFTQYLKWTRKFEKNNQLSSMLAFVQAHNKYIKAHENKLGEFKAELAKAKAEAEQAKAEAEQAKAEAEQAISTIEAMRNTKAWQASLSLRRIKDLFKV